MHLPPSQTTTPPPSSHAAHTLLCSSSIVSIGAPSCAPSPASFPSIDKSGSAGASAAFFFVLSSTLDAGFARLARPSASCCAIADGAMATSDPGPGWGRRAFDTSEEGRDGRIEISPSSLCSSHPGTRGQGNRLVERASSRKKWTSGTNMCAKRGVLKKLDQRRRHRHTTPMEGSRTIWTRTFG